VQVNGEGFLLSVPPLALPHIYPPSLLPSLSPLILCYCLQVSQAYEHVMTGKNTGKQV